jgi:23S rRNA pseudouridine2605 synthase
VSVNGKLVTEVGTKVNPRRDTVVVDGKKVSIPDVKNTFWVVVNKPKSVLTTMADDMARDTVLNLVPRSSELRMVPVGGMDRDHTGLILLTNDVGWIHPLTHPSFEHQNRYEVVVSGPLNEEKLETLRQGPLLPGDSVKCPSCSVKVIDVDQRSALTLLDLQLDEVKPLQLQRMMEVVGCELVGSKRTELGPIKLRNLKKAAWRELTRAEVAALKISCKKRPEAVYDKKAAQAFLQERRYAVGDAVGGGGSGSYAGRPSSSSGSYAGRPSSGSGGSGSYAGRPSSGGSSSYAGRPSSGGGSYAGRDSRDGSSRDGGGGYAGRSSGRPSSGGSRDRDSRDSRDSRDGNGSGGSRREGGRSSGSATGRDSRDGSYGGSGRGSSGDRRRS